MNSSLMKLCHPNFKVLLKQNMRVPKFQPEETISINLKFANNNIRLNLVPTVSQAKMAEGKGGGKSIGDVDAEVQKERAMIIDATVVRIMKARKVEVHNELVSSVINQISMFQA